MRKLFLAFLAMTIAASGAQATNSTINPNVPAVNSALSSTPIRNNFTAAYNDINTIYSTALFGVPTPTLSTLGGAEAINPVTHQFIAGLGTNGIFTLAQPAASDVSGLAASATTDTTNASNISSGTLPANRLPNPSATTLGGVQSKAAVTSNFLTSISTLGVPVAAQPAFSDISGTLGISQGGTGVTAAQGSGSKVQLSTGSFAANDCVKFDASGNTVTSGTPCATTAPYGRLFVIGDSIEAFGVVAGTAGGGGFQTTAHQRGYPNWMQALLGFPFDYSFMYVGTATPYLGNNVGIAGNWSYQVLDRIDRDLRRQNPTNVILQIGTNDVANNLSAAYIFANEKTIIDRILSMPSVRRLVVVSIWPRNNLQGNGLTAPQEAVRVAVNPMIQAYCALFPGKVTFINSDPVMLDSQTGALNGLYSYDGIHPNPYGSYTFANSLMVPWFQGQGGTSRVLRALPDNYSVGTIQYGNLLTNSSFTGTSGTVGTGYSGTIPTSWAGGRDIGSTVTAVGSTVSQADWNGNTANFEQFVFTAGGAGATHELMDFHQTANVTSTLVTGQYYQGEIEVIVSGFTGTNPLEALHFRLTDNTNGTFADAFGDKIVTGDNFPPGQLHILLRTPPIVAHGTTGFGANFYTRIDGTQTGTVTVQVAEPTMIPINQPQYGFLLRQPQQTITAAGAVAVTAANGTTFMNKTVGAATTITVQTDGLYPGDLLNFKDIKGDAATNNITLQLSSGNIEGASTYVMRSNYQSVWLQWDGTNAWIVSNTNSTPASGAFASRPSSPVVGQEYVATDIINGGGALKIMWDGTKWKPPGGVATIYHSGVQTTTHTGDTAETQAAVVPVLANLVSANGALEITAIGGGLLTNGTKTYRIYLGATSGAKTTPALYGIGQSATILGTNIQRTLANRGAQNSQITQANNNNYAGTTSSANTATTIDLSAGGFITFTEQLGSASDSIYYDDIMVKWIEP